ncbi:MAG: hypothetical protein WC606_04670 [Candidatus Absconditabacterales bacterium]
MNDKKEQVNVLMVDTTFQSMSIFKEAIKEYYNINIDLVKSHEEFVSTWQAQKEKFNILMVDAFSLSIFPNDTITRIRTQEKKENRSPTPILVYNTEESATELDKHTHPIHGGFSPDEVAETIFKALSPLNKK